MAEEDPTSVSVDEFAETWGLTDETMATLYELDPVLQADVIREFRPREGTRNANDLFASFMRSRIRSAQTGVKGVQPDPLAVMVSRGDVEEFVEKWGLNSDSHNLMLSLPSTVLDSCMRAWAPREEARDIDSMFQAFCKSRLANAMAALKSGKHVAPTAFRPAQPPLGQRAAAALAHSPTQDIDTFVQQHRLTRLANVLMYALQPQHPQVIVQIMSQFVATPGLDPTAQFHATWMLLTWNALQAQYRLSPETALAFKSMEPQVQAAVVKEFSPRNISSVGDINSLFGSFMRSRQRTAQMGGDPLAPSCATPNSRSSAGSHTPLFQTTGMKAAARPRGPVLGLPNMGETAASLFDQHEVADIYAQANSSALSKMQAGFSAQAALGIPAAVGASRKRALDPQAGFCSQWNLSATSEALFSTLRPDQQKEVQERFQPRANTRDINALFTKFVQSVQAKS